MSSAEEYERRYEKPYVPNRIVGFSGIDPAPDTEEVVRGVLDVMNAGQVRFDSGEIT